MKVFSRALAFSILMAVTLLARPGIAHAGLDNELSLVDGHGRTLTVQQWDTFLQGVYPLDRNRLTREWFHSGKARYTVGGDGSDEFKGSLELGYQIGFPWSLGVGINFSYTTPNIAFDGADGVAIGDDVNDIIPFQEGIVTPPLLPGVSISSDLGNGPGIQEVATFSVDVTGSKGEVAVSNAHGTVTGAAGGVLLRPYARLVESTGDSVTTYGAPWNMN